MTESTPPMRVLIVDDHDLLRDTLALYLAATPGVEVRTAARYADAVARIPREGPFDILLLDYRMPGLNGLEALKDAIAHGHARHVALMSGDAPRAVVQEALAAGASGFLPKTLPARSLRNAMTFMMLGEIYLHADFHAETAMPLDPSLDGLGRREIEVLRALSQGRPNKVIARDLGVSEAAIKLHLNSIYRRLGVANRTQAALLARERGLS